MPYSRWLREELRDFASDTLSAARLAGTGLFEEKAIRRIYEEHLAMKADHGRFLWGLLNYLVWHRHYIELRDHSRYVVQPRESRYPSVGA